MTTLKNTRFLPWTVLLSLVFGTAALSAAENKKPSEGKADKVQVIIQTVPPKKAMVYWGKKNLGAIPTPRALVVERPRDSGPMDLVIRAAGFLPVHTRATTFSDMRLAVKLTPVTDKHTLFGYRNVPTPANPDGGVPAPVPTPAPMAPQPAPTGPMAPMP